MKSPVASKKAVEPLTPFGEKIRELRTKRGITQKEMARELAVSPAYLSALERGKRGRPRWMFVHEIIRVLDVIWDEADELLELAGTSDPRIVIDTSDLSATATELANALSRNIGYLPDDEMVDIITKMNAARLRARR
ncbi:MAG: helix-turn-helix transcriptional regulator [Pseudomonadota bacterium]